jgi:hypothetical protein
MSSGRKSLARATAVTFQSILTPQNPALQYAPIQYIPPKRMVLTVPLRIVEHEIIFRRKPFHPEISSAGFLLTSAADFPVDEF